MNNVLIISEEYVKEYSDVMQNVDPKQLRMHIFESQDIYLKYLLKDSLYDEVFSQLVAYKEYVDGGGLDPIEDRVEERILNLIKKCKPVILYYTLYNASYSLYSRITNKGTNTQSSDYSESINIGIVKEIKKDWNTKAEAYSATVIDFINDNISDYPEYSSCSSTDCDCSCGGNNIYNTSLYLGDSI